jgi:hypothetical protein
MLEMWPRPLGEDSKASAQVCVRLDPQSLMFQTDGTAGSKAAPYRGSVRRP